MRRFFFRLFICVLLPALFIGCKAHRARQLISDTMEKIREAEKYDAEEYAGERLIKARGNINTSEHMLGMGRAKEAYRAAHSANLEASEALRISRKSKVAYTMRQAREAFQIVEENQAGR